MITATGPDLPLVSVITPVYNGEDQLADCIESVLAQTYRHWEYIILDNCSTDRTGEIADGYAKRDRRVRLFRNERLVSAAGNHNIAVTKMSSESKYCKFVHADDRLFPECLTSMVGVAEAHPSVGLVSAYRLDDRRVNLDGLPHLDVAVPGRQVCRATLLGELYVFGSPSSILFRSDLVRARPRLFDDSRFPRHWDSPACLEVLRGSDLGFVHQVLTYTQRSEHARTTFSKRINSYLAESLVALVTYGPEFLEPSEYDRRYRLLCRRYYAFLGTNLLRRDRFRRDREFWNYHDRTCSTLNLRAGTIRLGIAGVAAATRVLMAPARRVVRALWRAIR